MLQLQFDSIYEANPGPKWQKLFNTHWPAYKAWFQSKGLANHPDLKTCQEELVRYMPELLPTYEKLCELAGNDLVAHRFLTGWQPPAYITGCSQAVAVDEPQLVRNYDYHPHLSEGTLLNSAWNGKHVIAVGDCLMGVVDGMNSDGLVASLTFGGRKVVGKGFGIPFILRYVLEFCSNVDEAVEKLKKIPSHMAYNIMVLDKTGAYKMLQIAPDHEVKVTDMKVSTNHQGTPDWPAHANFSKTLLREKFLNELLAKPNQSNEEIAQAFLNSPLFNRQYSDGFGTIYTSVYHPAKGSMQLRWEGETLQQSFDTFEEGKTLITYNEHVPTAAVTQTQWEPEMPKAMEAESENYWTEYGKAWASGNPTQLALQVAKTISQAMGVAENENMQRVLEIFTAETKKRGQVPWEMLADMWASIGKGGYEENSK
ncbi:C45 family autoproteolytic acyltransferase/hydolase [Owenweeksia hongkongensis]|uniref:C45 family autoproteolytic acyltransferase/hydolase n=1 Tax=Owenweeksia hongkongensis TaxID=253245 RepID=UPI003A8D2DF6